MVPFLLLSVFYFFSIDDHPQGFEMDSAVEDLQNGIRFQWMKVGFGLNF